MIDLLARFVARRGVAFLDGGLATELEARGLSLDDPLWSARALFERPDLVAAVHRDYLEAGADVVTSATYQASFEGLAARGLSGAAAERFLVDGVALAARERDAFWSGGSHEGAREHPLVAASIGPYGAARADGSEYTGEYDLSAEALADWHRPRLRALERSGADILAFETIPSLPEVEAIAGLLDERNGAPAWISFQARDATSLADDRSVTRAAQVASRARRVVAVGVNCVPPELVVSLLETLARATDKALVAYPNRGDAWDAARRRWLPRAGAVDWPALVPQWRGAGAIVLGGCCRTTPADIRAIRSTFA